MVMPTELLNSLVQMNFANTPVAVAFLDAPPPGLTRIDRPEAAGCGYWKAASHGRSFYTTPEDHENGAIGAYTHGVAMSPAQGQELQGLIGTMIELKYLKSEEVPAIPHRAAPLRIVAYAPLEKASFSPDSMIFRGTARQITLLWAAAQAAGAFEAGSVM